MSGRAEFIEENLGLAGSCAARYTGRGIEYDDLLQTASLGLCKAADGFDPSRGVRFSTYAVPVILGELRQLFRSAGTVKVSRGLQTLARCASEAEAKFAGEHGREPTISELAELLGVSPEQAAEAVCASLRPVSLSDGDDERAPELPVESFDSALTDRVALCQALDTLNDADRELITERYVRRSTQSVTAGKLGMTQVQVCRREKKILARLRELMMGIE